MGKNKHKKFYTTIGEFMSKVNSIELYINIVLEKIIYENASKLKGKKVTEEVIDVIQAESIKRRINFIILFISMTNEIDSKVSKIIEELKSFSTFYNKHIRDVRDFVAHNPLTISSDRTKMVSSRRYKGKLNSLELASLIDTSELLNEKLNKLDCIAVKLSEIYPYEIKRELN